MDFSQFAFLQPKHLSAHTPFIHSQPEFKPVLPRDPALSVMTDFKEHPAYTTNENVSIQTALQQMKFSKVRSLFFVDQHDKIVGHVAARDIQGNKPAMLASHFDIKPAEVTVKMLMIPASDMVSLHVNELSNACVGHIARLFHDLGVNYIFVVDADAEGVEVMRGIFSISRVNQQLGENVMGDLSSHSVAEMNQQI